MIAQELTQARGGSLDILAADGDTYYSVEVQLGEVDAQHGFRVFDYWARNRDRYPNKTHVAVLIAESARGRFGPALQALAEYAPLIVIELRTWRGESEAVLVPQVVFRNESLDVGTIATAGGTRTADDWQSDVTSEAWSFHERFVELVHDKFGEVRVDYTPQSYIGVRRGRRVWAPLWLIRDGARTYLPDPDGSREDEPSLAFEHFSQLLAPLGLDLSWTSNYNAGSNPISIVLRSGDLEKGPVLDLLRASFAALEPGARPWSEQSSDDTPAASS